MVLFLLSILSCSHELRHLWVSCCSVFCWVKTFAGIILISAYHMLIHGVQLVTPRPSQGNWACNWIVILYWSRFDFPCLVLHVHELDSVIRGCIYILFLFFLYTLLQYVQESSMFYSVGPFSLSTWHIFMCICSSQTLNLSLPSNFLLIIRIWFSQAVYVLYISSMVWIYMF